MDYIIPILLYLGMKPSEIEEKTKIKAQNIYHANRVFKDQKVMERVSEIMVKRRVNDGV